MVHGLFHEFSLSSHEFVSLFCLPSSLLRIPDTPTLSAFIPHFLSFLSFLFPFLLSPSLFFSPATSCLLFSLPLSFSFFFPSSPSFFSSLSLHSSFIIFFAHLFFLPLILPSFFLPLFFFPSFFSLPTLFTLFLFSLPFSFLP
ncbi:hypothetical protein, partial [Salmonella enterica]|uniref:hypothetical protein n=1 Tax=Salmonella enterica TaxID=28901 RepID=UPI00398C8064